MGCHFSENRNPLWRSVFGRNSRIMIATLLESEPRFLATARLAACFGESTGVGFQRLTSAIMKQNAKTTARSVRTVYGPGGQSRNRRGALPLSRCKKFGVDLRCAQPLIFIGMPELEAREVGE
jgi:hypothetical protein